MNSVININRKRFIEWFNTLTFNDKPDISKTGSLYGWTWDYKFTRIVNGEVRYYYWFTFEDNGKPYLDYVLYPNEEADFMIAITFLPDLPE